MTRTPSSWLVAASESCIRAGTLAIVAASLALTLAPSLRMNAYLDALGDYISARNDLTDALTSLDSSLCWQQLRGHPRGGEADTWSLSQLARLKCTQPMGEPAFANKYVSGLIVEFEPGDAIGPDGKPAAPRISGASFRLSGAAEITAAIAALNDQRRLADARSFSPGYDRSIYRWQLLLYRLKARRLSDTATVIPPDVPVPGPDDSPKPSDQGESHDTTSELLELLRLSDVRELAHAEPVSVADFESASQLYAIHGLPGVAQTRFSSAIAPTVLLALLALSSLWLWMSAREYVIQAEGQAEGGAIAMFGRTYGSRAALVILLSLPPVASITLARESQLYPWPNTVCAGVVAACALTVAWHARRAWR